MKRVCEDDYQLSSKKQKVDENETVDKVYFKISDYAVLGTRCLPWLHGHKQCAVREVILEDKTTPNRCIYILTTLGSHDLLIHLRNNNEFRRLTSEDIEIHKICNPDMANTLCTLEF